LIAGHGRVKPPDRLILFIAWRCVSLNQATVQACTLALSTSQWIDDQFRPSGHLESSV